METEFQDILKAGAANGDDPVTVAKAIDFFHNDVSADIENSDASEEEKFTALLRLDDDRNATVAGLRTAAMNQELIKQFPDPVDRQAFLHTMSNIKKESGRSFYPSEYELQGKAVENAAAPFEDFDREYNSIKFGDNLVGSYSARQMGGGNFQFLIKTNPEQIAKPSRMVSAEGLSSVTNKEPEFLSRKIVVDRTALVGKSKERVAELEKSKARLSELEKTFSDDQLNQFAYERGLEEKRLEAEKQLLTFREKAPLSRLAEMEMVGLLKDDEQFKGSIPNDWAEQFINRPVLNVVKGLAKTGAAAIGDEETLTADDPVSKLAPGMLRNRFENKGEGQPIADHISQGIESLITFVAPGAVLKVAKGAVSATGKAGQAVVAARELDLATGAANSVLSKAGFGLMGTRVWGDRYAEEIQRAGSVEDPAEAARIRAWAPFIALGDAVKEIVTEKMLPGDVESLITKGLTGSLAKRILNAGFIAPGKEGLEEVGGVILGELTGAAVKSVAPDAPLRKEPEDALEAFKGGFFGGMAFAPAAFFGKDIKEDTKLDRTKVWHYNGADFDSLTGAESAKAQIETDIKEVLEPAGLVSQEDAVAFLEEFDRKENPTIEEKDLAAKVLRAAPQLPTESSPAPGDRPESGATGTGGVATPAGGIAPNGGLPQTPSPVGEVNGETLPPKVDLAGEALTLPQAAGVNPAPGLPVEAPTAVQAAPATVAALKPVEAPPAALQKAARIEEIVPGIKYFEPDTSTPTGQVLGQFTKATGARVVLFEGGASPNGKVTDGFVISGDPNTIYLAKNTQQPFLHVLGHEFFHTREAMPQYQTFLEDLKRLEPEAWAKSGQTESEFVADVVGSRFTQKDFWDRLQKEMNPGTFARFVAFVRQIWQKIKSEIGPRNVEVQNVEAVDKMLASLLPLQPQSGAIGDPVQGATGYTIWTGLRLDNGNINWEKAGTRGDANSAKAFARKMARDFQASADSGRFVGIGDSGDADMMRVYTDKGTESWLRDITDTRSVFPENIPQSTVTARFDGSYKSGGKVIGEAFTIIAPGHVKDGSSTIAPPGTDQAGLDALARQSVEDFDNGVVPDLSLSQIVSPAQDAEYMAAVESGDVARQQAMVDAAAKAAGYNVGPVYHGTGAPNFTIWKIDPKNDLGAHFSSSPMGTMNGRQIGAHLHLANPLRLRDTGEHWDVKDVFPQLVRLKLAEDDRDIIDRLSAATGRADYDTDDTLDQRDIVNFIKLLGFDGVVYLNRAEVQRPGESTIRGDDFFLSVSKRGVPDDEFLKAIPHATDSYIVFDPAQIKSADPITRDEDGNVIPLEKRFDPRETDIRFSQVPLTIADMATLDSGATGSANLAVEYLRFRYGIEGEKFVKKAVKAELLQAALNKIRSEPDYTDNLINSLLKRPVPVEKVDAVILALATLEAQKISEVAATEVSMAAERGDDFATAEALDRLGPANAKLRALLEIHDRVGTEAAQAFELRKHLLQRDYTFVRMESAFQSAKLGQPLTSQESKFIQEMNRKLAEAERKIKELENKNYDKEIEEYILGFFGEVEKVKEQFKPGLTDAEFKSRLKVSAGKSKDRLKDRFRSAVKTSTVIDGVKFSVVSSLTKEERADLVTIGSDLIENGADTLDAFRAKLVEELGGDAAVFAERIFPAAKEFLASIKDKHKAVKGKPKPSTKGAAEAHKDAAAATTATDPQADTVPDRRLVKALVRANVEAGLKGPRDVFSATLADVQALFPLTTEDDLKRIFSNYGKAIFPSKEEIEMEISELNSIARLEVTIADLEAGLPALRTGPQRNEATAEVRRLQKEVNELKRKHGFDQKSENQLKGALDAAKTRLRNEIEDLNIYIEQGGRTPEEKTGKTPTVGDAELDALRKQRDELKKVLAKIEGPRQVTEAERIESTLKALARAEEVLTRRLEGEAEVKTGTPVTSEEVEERRSYLATLRQLIQEDKDKVRPMKTPVFVQLDRAEKALEKVNEIYAEFKATGKLPEAKEPRKSLSTAEKNIRNQIEAVRKALAEEKREMTAPARQLEAAQAAFDRMVGIMDGTIVPAKSQPLQALTQAEEDLRLQVAAMRQALAEEKREAAAPGRRIDAAQKAVDRLTAILEGTGTPAVPTPREALTQAEEDLMLQAAAMRQLLAQEAREAGKPARQLKAAQASLARLEAALAGPLRPKDRSETVPLSEEEKEVREQIISVQKELAALRAADPDLNLEKDKKIIATRIATLKARMSVGDYAKKKPRDKKTDVELERLKAEYVLVQKEWHRRLFEESLKNRTLKQRVKDFFLETLKLARIFELGGDFGIILRQGGRVLGRPDVFAQAINAGARALTQVGEQKEWQKIQAHPRFQLWLNMGLEITDPDDIVAYKREEAFQSRWLMKEFKADPADSPAKKVLKKAADLTVGSVLKPTRALARGQIIAIDRMRLGMAEGMAATLSKWGVPTEAEMRSYARMVNASTGRGSIDAEWERGVGQLFLAYRWAKSGLEYITLRPLWQPVFSGDFTLRSSAVIAAEYGRNLTGIGLFLMAYAASHLGDDDDKWKIEWDPRSTRFAKLPFGDTLVDPTAGLAQWVTLLSKMATGEKKSQSGKLTALSEASDKEQVFGQGRLDEIGSFLRYKLNPILGAGMSIISGRDAVGEKTTALRETTKMVTPLIIGDVYKAVKANGVPEGLALSFTAFFGMSIQTWEEKHRENISTSDRAWLYNNALSIPKLDDDVTVGSVLGHDKKEQKKRGTDVRMTDEARKDLLAKSLPGVEKIMLQAREKVKNLPADPDKRASRLHDLQNDIDRRINAVREKVLRAERALK